MCASNPVLHWFSIHRIESDRTSKCRPATRSVITHPTKDMSTYVHHKPYLTLNIGGASHLVNGFYPSYGMVWINYVYIYMYTMNYKPLTKWDAQHGFVKMGHPSMSWRNKIVLQSNWPWPDRITSDEPTGAPPEGEIHGFHGPYTSFLVHSFHMFPQFFLQHLKIFQHRPWVFSGFFRITEASRCFQNSSPALFRCSPPQRRSRHPWR